jgi:hypothetical protein
MKMEITLQCPKCNSSVSLKINKKTDEILMSWSIPIDTDKMQDLSINQIQEMIFHLRSGRIIRVKCYDK